MKIKQPFDKIATAAPIDFLMKYIKGRGSLCGCEFDSILHLPYKALKHTLPDLFKDHKYDQGLHFFLVQSGKSITFRQVKKVAPEVKLTFIKWLQEQYDAVHELEREHLHRRPKPKLVRAGINKLDILGDKPLLGTLAKELNKTREQVEQMPYEEVFDVQLELVIKGDIADEVARIDKEEARINQRKHRRK